MKLYATSILESKLTGKIKTDQTSAGLKQYQNSKGLIFQSVVREKSLGRVPTMPLRTFFLLKNLHTNVIYKVVPK